MHNPVVEKEFERALEAILARVFRMENVDIAPLFSSPELRENTRIAIAYSGGLDSSVLLHLAYRFAVEKGLCPLRISRPSRIESACG